MKNKSLFIATFLLFFCAVATVMQAREKNNINREWKFILGNPADAEKKDKDISNWLDANLPHSFSIPYFMWTKVYNGYGWYRKEIDVDTDWLNKTVTLEFEGSFIETEVYVNEIYVGKHVGGYTGFVFDITQYLESGKNLIAVKVNNLWKPDVAPRAGDHQFSGGIYRDVYLNITDKLHVDWCGTFITTPSVSTSSATCNAKTEIRNNYAEDKICSVKTIINNPGGTKVSEIETSETVKTGEVYTFDQTLPAFSNPDLWTPETPKLYTAVTTVSVGGQVVDEYETSFGVRWFEWTADQGFFLNGNHYYLLGANVHQDQAGWGDAVTNAAIRRDVQMIKDAGFNCIRGSHYPHDPSFSQACDEIGLLFFQENAFWGMGGGGGDVGGWGTPSSGCYPPSTQHQDAFDNSVLTQLGEMIRIHRNHASIAAWSMSNEPFFTDDATDAKMKELLVKSVKKAYGLDQSRGIAIGGSQRKSIDKLNVDVVTPIAFYNGDGASMDSGQNPGVPNLVSEYGTDMGSRPGTFTGATGHVGDMGHFWTRPAWRSGHVIWCAFEHGTVGGYGLASTGIIDYFRLPKRQYQWYVEAYKNGTQNPVAPIFPSNGTPAKLKLEASNTAISSDNGTDDAQLIITVLDANDKHISNAVPVTLTIESGPGEFPTGRSITFTPSSVLNKFSDDEAADIVIRDGLAAIAFRSYHAGTSVIKATSVGLQDASITITTQGTHIWQEGVTEPVVDRPYKRYDASQDVNANMSLMTLAHIRPTTASSTKEGTDRTNVNDGNTATKWEAADGDTEKFWQVALEDTYCVNRIELTFPDDKEYRYIIQVAESNGEWKTVVNQTQSDINDRVRMAFGNFGCNISGVRVRFTSENAALAEVRVGGNKETGLEDTLLGGTIIGTAGSWGNDSETMKEVVMDFSLDSFFDGPGVSGTWVGLDLGYGMESNVMQMEYSPRINPDGNTNFADRMVGGKFQIATKSDFSDAVTLFDVTSTPAYNTMSVGYSANTNAKGRYVRYLSTDAGNGNVAEIRFYGESGITTINEVTKEESATVHYDRLTEIIHASLNTMNYYLGNAALVGVDGRMLYKIKFVGNSLEIPAHDLSKGVYVLVLSYNNKTECHKVGVY